MRDERNVRNNRWIWAVQLGLLVWLVALSSSAQNYEGQWNRTYLQFSVNVENWGEHCGVRPRSYNSRAVKETEILQNKGHLFFSTGGLRTDRCNSPNPALNTLTTSRSANMWTRTCETPKGASKYEKIDYTFSGSGDKLTYVAESSFRWSLNGDLCVVRWVERRTYQRVQSEADGDAGSPIVKVHKSSESARKARGITGNSVCATPGKVKRLILAPLKARISPSQSLCYQLKGVDANGCRFPVSADWTATQNGVSQNQLMSDRGCFKAGDNAAESEGIFTVSAQYRGISATTTVEVAYPDIGDLARARLDIASELDETDSASTGLTQAGQNGAGGSMGVMSPDAAANGVVPGAGRPAWMLWALVGAVVVFVLLVTALIVVLLRRNHGATDSGQIMMPSPGPQPDSQPPYAVSAQSPAPVRMVCPRCGVIYPSDARFCPLDAAELTVSESVGPTDLRSTFPPPRGMICPNCRRGYEMGAKFCPHDSTALVEYESWRQKMGGNQ